MPRYIDAEALKKDLTRFYDNEITAKELIDEQPTADVQPVKHGRWILCDDGYVRCSECNRKAFIENDETILTDFCHGCGADMIMDGGSDE